MERQRDHRQRNILRPYIRRRLAGQIHGDHIGIINIPGIIQQLFNKLAAAIRQTASLVRVHHNPHRPLADGITTFFRQQSLGACNFIDRDMM